MLARLCQLKSLSQIILAIVIVISCSSRKDQDSAEAEILTTFNKNWFAANPEHAITDRNSEPVPHLLFDTTPEFNSADKTVNVIISTPENSEHSYAIDPNSGQRYYTHTYCKQKDIWNSYSGMLNRPVYSIGFIPRVLDQLGESQKIIVWSKRKSFHDYVETNYHKVRMVGAYVEQVCKDGNCLGKNSWISRLVFIGVDAEDTTLAHVKSVADFKNHIEWEVSKAHLENIDGRNSIGDKIYPSVKVGPLIEYEDAFDYFKKRSIFLTDLELKKIQKGCHILYDSLYEEVGKTRPEDLQASTLEQLKVKTTLIENLKKNKKPAGFAQRLATFTRKYFNEITTCEKFVYHGNINRDQDAFWFLSNMAIYFRLHREGYFFDCLNKTWKRNVLNSEGLPVYDLKRDITTCDEKGIDQAIDFIPNFLTGLKSGKEYFRFVEYDNHSFGSHKKMYSWVKMNSRKFECSKDPNEEIKKELKTYPDDVTWKDRQVNDITIPKIIK